MFHSELALLKVIFGEKAGNQKTSLMDVESCSQIEFIKKFIQLKKSICDLGTILLQTRTNKVNEKGT